MAKNDAEFTIDGDGNLIPLNFPVTESSIRIPLVTRADDKSPYYRVTTLNPKTKGKGEAFLVLPSANLAKVLGATAALTTKRGLEQATLAYDFKRGVLLKAPTELIGSIRPGKEQEFKKSSQNKAVSASAGRPNADVSEYEIAKPIDTPDKKGALEVSKKNKQRLAMQMAKKNRI